MSPRLRSSPLRGRHRSSRRRTRREALLIAGLAAILACMIIATLRG